MEMKDWTGIIGDFLTFVGGIILARDAILAVGHFSKEENTLNTVEKLGRQVPLESKDKHPLQNSDDVRRMYLRLLAKGARRGALVLAVGYLFLLVTRVLEILEKIICLLHLSDKKGLNQPTAQF
jgi:hypothetical protein